MTYASAIENVKKLDLNKPHLVKQHINHNYEPDLQDALCAKWYAITIKNMEYIEKQPKPIDYINMKATEQTGGNIKAYESNPMVQRFIKHKRLTEKENYNNFGRLKWCYKTLDQSEHNTREIIKEKIRTFLLRASSDELIPLYDFTNDPIKQEIF